MGQVALLSPYQSVLYTWDDPTKERTLMWNIYNRNKPGFPAFIGKVSPMLRYTCTIFFLNNTLNIFDRMATVKKECLFILFVQLPIQQSEHHIP